MQKLILILLLAAFVNSAGLDAYNVEFTQTSTSGISAGGYMAVQFQIAFSDIMVGAGIVAGGPMMCAEGNLLSAITPCMSTPSSMKLSNINGKVYSADMEGEIDPLSNLKFQNVYLYSGTLDTVVKPGVMSELETQYKEFGVQNIVSEFDIASQHAWITDNYGNKCSYKGSPFISNCNYDQAKYILQTIYGDLNEPVKQVSKNLIKFSQKSYIHKGDSLNDNGYVYIPTACQNMEKCKIHISFHGCKQDIGQIGTKFVQNTGLNEYAESNNIIVLYPQAKKSTYNPSNPNGCFDWWGYTNTGLLDYNSIKYATKQGTQMISVWNMINDLAQDNSKIRQEIIE